MALEGPQYGSLTVTSRVPWSTYTTGDKSKFCRRCGDFSKCKERVRGQQPVLTDGEWKTIIIDQFIGECGHVVQDDSA